MTTLKRLMNIAYRMLFDGEVFYVVCSPRMTIKEYDEICKLGFWVQCEYPHPPESKMFYMMPEKRITNIAVFKNLNSSKSG